MRLAVEGPVTEFEIKVAKDLSDYLLAHESDIAHGINDFGTLTDLFRQVTNREPKP